MGTQDKFRDNLIDMKLLLDSFDQNFFLICGTLLGAYRDNKFIEHDDDIDIGIFFNELKPNLKDYIVNSGKFTLIEDYGDYNHSQKYKFLHLNDSKIDIFIHYEIEPNIYYYATFLSCDGDKKIRLNSQNYIMWINTIMGISNISFIGNTFKIPTNVKQYLIESYGEKYMIKDEYTYIDGLKNNKFKNIIFKE